MKLIIITGTCGSGKSTMKYELKEIMDNDKYAFIDSDDVQLNWWDYAGTDHEDKYAEDTLKRAVEIAGGKDLFFATCMNPLTYMRDVEVPECVEASYFVCLCPPDEVIEKRLWARPEERGFTSEEKIRPHVEYNQWFRKNKGKVNLFIDNGEQNLSETAKTIKEFAEKVI